MALGRGREADHANSASTKSAATKGRRSSAFSPIPMKRIGDPEKDIGRAVVFLVGLDATKWQYQNGVRDQSLLDPTAWVLDQFGLDRPGNGSVQLDMLYDYRTNVPLYPQFQGFFRKYQPPTLILWGKNDFIFPPDGADLYKSDLKNLEMHMFDTGHFALETHGDEMAEHILNFFA